LKSNTKYWIRVASGSGSATSTTVLLNSVNVYILWPLLRARRRLPPQPQPPCCP
jgi:hypothetical protein